MLVFALLGIIYTISVFTGQPAYEMLETHHDWTPSLLLGHNEVKVPDKDRFARHLKRQKAEKTDF